MAPPNLPEGEGLTFFKSPFEDDIFRIVLPVFFNEKVLEFKSFKLFLKQVSFIVFLSTVYNSPLGG